MKGGELREGAQRSPQALKKALFIKFSSYLGPLPEPHYECVLHPSNPVDGLNTLLGIT